MLQPCNICQDEHPHAILDAKRVHTTKHIQNTTARDRMSILRHRSVDWHAQDGCCLAAVIQQQPRLKSEEIFVCLQTLHSLQPTLQAILEQQQLAVHVKGLEYMNDDPSAMHVAYVDVQDPQEQPDSVQKLQQICAAVVDAFSDAGLLLSRDERCPTLPLP